MLVPVMAQALLVGHALWQTASPKKKEGDRSRKSHRSRMSNAGDVLATFLKKEVMVQESEGSCMGNAVELPSIFTSACSN